MDETGIVQQPIGDSRLPHQQDVDSEIDHELEGLSDQGVIANQAVRTTHGAISDAVSLSSSYVQAEGNALRAEVVALNAANLVNEGVIDSLITKVNLMLGVMRDAGLIPTA